MSVWGTDKITLIGTQELKELRELNAELLEELEALIPILERAGRPTVAEGVRQRMEIAKAEALK